jgi:hypothetical protein
MGWNFMFQKHPVDNIYNTSDIFSWHHRWLVPILSGVAHFIGKPFGIFF